MIPLGILAPSRWFSMFLQLYVFKFKMLPWFHRKMVGRCSILFTAFFFRGLLVSCRETIHIAQNDPSLLRTCLWLVQFLPRIGAASMRWKVVVMPFARILKSFAYGPRKRRPPLFCFKLWGLTARPGKHFGGVSHDCKGENKDIFIRQNGWFDAMNCIMDLYISDNK